MAVVGSGGLKPLDRLAIGYFAATGLLALVFGGVAGAAVGAAHAVAVLAILRLKSWRYPRASLWEFLRLSYAVLVTPAAYAELSILNRFLTERFFDATVQEWDAALFGLQPSVELSSLFPSLALSEALHLGYMAYYAIIPGALLGVYWLRGAAALHRTSCAVAAVFFVSYLGFVFFPVAGPRYEFPQIGGEIGRGAAYGLVHTILEAGSSKGTAFPSTHIGASLVAILAAGREDARLFWLLIVPQTALAIGAVYGRFHYASDAVAGIAVALLIFGGMEIGRSRGKVGLADARRPV